MANTSPLGTGAQKNKSVILIAQNDAFVIPNGPPKCSKRLAALACTRLSRRFCIPKTSCGGRPRSAPKMNESKMLYQRYGAVRSFFGGFSSTAGYVPGNEARVPKDVSGVAPFELIISLGRQPFLSGRPGSAFRLILAKPFGFGSGRSRQWLSAPSVRERCVTTSVPSSDAGQNARKQSRL